ncbi:mechanosensitive ion channel domain-containing protein [Mesorhizobium sp. BE184]|uniref:mechanosensitive ion channel family protein n=1 Tax=Mesorhizobium sp. BE184 TaxID=2817714 RepID=UPI00286514C5|nr:mechanosensitive ion channel domain-containing protein [Mesorhizobium sp. BE184]MDR7033636.1 small conductance mechanosensitive channel [Mesorhizobium sp. BE184]
MAIDAQGALVTIQAGLAQLSTLIVSYSFSALGAIVLMVAGYLLAGVAERSTFAGLGHISGFDATLRHFFSKMVRYAILILVFIMVLGQFGVQTASIIAAVGAIGLAIGLALQGTLQNIAAGIMLLALRPIRIGEYVEIGSVAGTVEEIGLFATRLRALDGIYILAPNSTLWNTPVRNFNRNGVRRNDIVIGIAYSDNIDHAQETLLDLARADKRVRSDPAASAFVSTLGDSSVGITLRYWTSAADFFATKLSLTKLAKERFDMEGISIPFPQQEVVYREMKPGT